MIAPLLALASLAATLAGTTPRCVLIVGTNDLHGHLTPRTFSDPTGARPPHEAGGLARFGGILRELRARSRDPVLLLDAGDLFQGTLESNVQHGRAVVAAYNVLGYDASTLGNHEFDFGPEAPDLGPQGALKARLAEAHFPFLAANLIDTTTQKTPTWPHLAPSKLFDLHGLKVGVIGIANPETPGLTVRAYVSGLAFVDPLGPVVREAKRLRDSGAKLIILLAHIGGSCEFANPDARTSCERPSQLQDLLDRLPFGTIDVALGGHTHRFMAHWVDSVPALEAGAEGRWYSELEACVPKQGSGLDRDHTFLTPPREILAVKAAPGKGAPEIEDARVTEAIAPYLQAVEVESQRLLGPILAAPLHRDYHALSPLGSMAAEAIRERGKAQFGVLNAGGLRADLNAGPLSYGALYEAFPFDNHVVVLDLSGKDLKDFINALGASGHGFPQTAGLILRGTAGAFEILSGLHTPIDPAGHYKLATLDFLLHGGDGTQAVVQRLAPAQIDDLGGSVGVRDAILDYLKGPVGSP